MVKKYPPVAADIPPFEAVKAVWFSGTEDDDYEALRSYLQVSHAIAVDSGRAGLYAILKAALPPGSLVVLPGYTCFTIAAAVVKAGFRPVLCDNSPSDLGYNLASLQKAREMHDRIGAVVVSHLFGIPLSVAAVKEIMGPDVLVIDDAAQGMGVKVDGRMLGTSGDCGVYSFGRGKNLSTIGGGLIVTDNDELARKVRRVIDDEFQGRSWSLVDTVSALLYNAATMRLGYGIVSRLPGIRIGQTIYEPGFALDRMDGYRRHLLKRLLGSLDRLTLERQKTADDYRSILIVREGVEIPLSSVNGFPGNLRFPVLVDSQKRERILASPEARRFGLTGMYPSPLSVIRDLPAAGDYTTEEGSGKIAKSILTLPTHRGIGKAGRNMVRRITELIK